MYIAAEIQLPNGNKHIIAVCEEHLPIAILKFHNALRPYAKKQNKLLRIACDHPLALKTLRKSLKNITIDYGVITP